MSPAEETCVTCRVVSSKATSLHRPVTTRDTSDKLDLDLGDENAALFSEKRGFFTSRLSSPSES